jgi:hypothetical protein
MSGDVCPDKHSLRVYCVGALSNVAAALGRGARSNVAAALGRGYICLGIHRKTCGHLIRHVCPG